MALDSWTWFTKLAEKGSFTKAAESLEISQQTLSARLASLEKEIGAKLIQRGTPLALTPAGMAFLSYAREQQQAQEDLLREIGEVTGSGAGVIKIGITPIRCRTIMPAIIKAVKDELPDVRFEFTEGTNREVIHMAERGEVDAVIARFGNSHPGIKVTPLYQENIDLVISPELLSQTTGLSPEEAAQKVATEGLSALRDCPFVLGSVDDITGRIAYSELRHAGVRPRCVINSESLTALLTFAIEGIGAAFSPTIMIDKIVGSEKLVRIPLSDQATYQISLGLPMKRSASPWRALEVFADTVVSTLK